MKHTLLSDEAFLVELKHRLTNAGINYDEFIKHITNTTIWLIGSYLTQIFLGESWSGSDLHIYIMRYCDSTYTDRFIDYLNKTFDKQTEGTYNGFHYTTYKTSKGLIIRVTIDSYISGWGYVVQEYDFDFCRITYGGEGCCVFQRRTSIENKEAYDLEHKEPTLETYNNILKYENRGFTITNKKDVVKRLVEKGIIPKDLLK